MSISIIKLEIPLRHLMVYKERLLIKMMILRMKLSMIVCHYIPTRQKFISNEATSLHTKLSKQGFTLIGKQL